MIVANDHEEVGSGSAEDASGPFLEDTLPRGRGSRGPRPPGVGPCHVAVDAGVARHGPRRPSELRRPSRSEHRLRLGGGPVIKVNANQSYASDAGSIGWFEARARDVGIRPQLFVLRADLPCGSTIAPLTATRLGVQTVDVGSPVLSMHSVREQAHAADIRPTIATVRAHLTTSA